MYEGKYLSDSESTSRPHRVEVKLRPCNHEILLKTAYISIMYKGGKWTKWVYNAIFNGKCVLETK